MTRLEEDDVTPGATTICGLDETDLVRAGLGDEIELVRRAGLGDEEAFGHLYDRYLARVAWYFTIFAPRRARGAIAEVLKELFGTLDETSDLPFAERAYRLARAVEQRRTAVPAKVEVERAATDRAPSRTSS